MYNKLYQAFNSKWLINSDSILTYAPLLLSLAKGSSAIVDALMQIKEGEDKENKPYAVSLSAMANIDTVNHFDLMDEHIEDNSVAIIPIQGVIVSWKTMELVRYIRLAEMNPKIIGIVFLINTPGGMVFYTDIAAQVIKDCSLPTVGYVMNMCASAGMWLRSGMDKVVVSSKLDRLGSIGVMTSVKMLQSFFKEKLNIDVMDFYATKSTKKNGLFRELLAGNEKPIIDDLDFTNEIFHAAIRENMGIKSDSPIFDGSVYYAEEAINLGLADEIGTIEYAIELCNSLSLKKQMLNLNS